ncbi:MAG: trigger factor [Candidatus Nealsonbacteria bacterium]|nr:trigger factor [Candidatus Nealsonbacteria bacterium]
METSIKKLPKSKIEIEITLSPSEFDEYYKKAILNLKEKIEMKGFRKGKVPLEIIEKEISQAEILNQAAQLAIRESYFETVEKEKLEIIEKAEIEILKIAKSNLFIFKAKVSVLPGVDDLPDYKKIAAACKEKEISIEEKEVKDAMDWILKSRAKLIALDREAQNGDFVEIEYSSLQIEGGAKKKDSFLLGQGHFIKGFEEKLEGMKAGEEKEFSLILDKNNIKKEIAGKEVSFRVKMKSIFKMELPELNDEFAKSLGKFENLAALKKNLREGIKMEKSVKEKERHRTEILEKIADLIKWDLPESLIEQERERLFQDFKMSFSQNAGIFFEDYLKSNQKNEIEIKDSFLRLAEKNIKNFLILRKIFEKEKIEVSEGEVNREIEENLKQYPEAGFMEKNLDLEKIKHYTEDRIKNEKVFQFLENLSKLS